MVNPAWARARRWLARHAHNAVWGLAGSLAIAGAVLSVASTLSWPYPDWWKSWGWLANTALYATTLGTIAVAGWRIRLLDRRVLRLDANLAKMRAKLDSEARRRQLSESCKALGSAVSQLGIPRERIGVSAWKEPTAGEALVRLCRWRGGARSPSAVSWRNGHGAIGQAWRGPRRSVIIDMSDVRETLTEEQFTSMDAASRGYMSWPEWQATMDLKTIWATAIYDDNNAALGLVSVDVAERGHYERVVMAERDSMVQQMLSVVALELGAHDEVE